MADKKWTDKLRQQMSGYTQTPPEGLWESIEGAAAQGAASRVGLIAAVKSFFSGPAAKPFVYVALAGAAAAVAALLFLRTPALPGEDFVAGPAENLHVAVADNTLKAEEAEPDITTEDGAGAKEPGVAVSVINPIIQERSAIAGDAAEEPAAAASDGVTGIQEGDAVKTEDSADTEASGVATSVITPNTKERVAGSGDEAEESGKIYDPFAESEPAAGKPRKPLLAMSLGGGFTPGAATSSFTEYAIPQGPFRGQGVMGSASMVPVLGRNKEIETNVSRRLNFQIALMVSLNLSRQWALESGLQFTGLGSTTTSGTETLTSSTWENLNYIGIPLHVIFTPWDFDSWSVYFSAGPAVEYGIYRKWSKQEGIGGSLEAVDSGHDTPGDWVFSGSLAAGVQYRPWRSGAFFLQPGVTARIVGQESPSSYYTERPFSFQLTAGYRILF